MNAIATPVMGFITFTEPLQAKGYFLLLIVLLGDLGHHIYHHAVDGLQHAVGGLVP